jgi:Cu/Ag efflux protein CusF
MKKIVVVLASLFLCAVLPTLSYSEEKAVSSKTRQITGEVTSVDVKANTVTIQKKDRKITVAIEEDTKITQCTMKTAITDIKIGDRVTARYKETGNQNTAKSVAIKEIEEDDN